MISKLFPFIVLFIFIHFQGYMTAHVIVNEIYMFSVSHSKTVTVA